MSSSPKVVAVSPNNGVGGDLITIQALFTENPSKYYKSVQNIFFYFFKTNLTLKYLF